MFDHLSLTVADFDKALAFYSAALAPLGYGSVQITERGDRSAGFGRGKALQFWISEQADASRGLHFAFQAEDHKAVDAFYAAAIAAGGRSNGEPGIRERYHASYYAAFVLDPAGHNVKVVCHFPGRLEDQFTEQGTDAISG